MAVIPKWNYGLFYPVSEVEFFDSYEKYQGEDRKGNVFVKGS